MNKTTITWNEIYKRADEVAYELCQTIDKRPFIKLYGIPRGGIFVAQAIVARRPDKFELVTVPEHCHVLIDDIVDSGKTRDNYMSQYKDKYFRSLYEAKKENCWLVFPWETMTGETGPEENIVRILEYIGEDPKREGLKETPNRVIRSYNELYGGYKQDPKNIITVFEEDPYDEMVLLKDIEVYSTCEHHMLPFFGKAHIAYIPDKKVIGISKLARILEIYARRLQIQERLCQQVTKCLDDMLQPKGSACIIQAQHFCMTSRGVQKQNSIMTTSSLTGVFRTNIDTRNELMSII